MRSLFRSGGFSAYFRLAVLAAAFLFVVAGGFAVDGPDAVEPTDTVEQDDSAAAGWNPGTAVWLSMTAAVVLAAAGGFLAGSRLSEHRHAKDLERTDALFHSIFNQSPIPITIVDADDRIIDMNERFLELMGRPRGDFPDVRAWFDCAFPVSEEREKVWAEWESVQRRARLGAGIAFTPSKHAITTGDGSVRNIEIWISAVQGLIISVYQDETELRRKQTELEAISRNLEELVEARGRELEASQKALFHAEKNVGLGRMVAGFAHEVNTPIGVALTAASFLSDETSIVLHTVKTGISKPAFEQYLDHAKTSTQLILQNIERAASLISGFKQVSADQVSLVLRTFHLNAYLNQIMTSLHPRFRKTPHIWSVEAPDTLLVTYPGALAQIVTNLVTNSLTYAFPEGRSGLIRISARIDEGKVELRYEDDGVGIPESAQPRIFEPFFSIGPERRGTGLGLNIVHSLVVEWLHGSIESGRSPMGGVLFTIVFPASLEDIDLYDPRETE